MPHQFGAALTFAVAAAEQDDGQALSDLSNLVSLSSDFVCDCSAAPPIPFADGVENAVAIRCGDSGPSNATLDDMRNVYAEMARDSPFAEMWSAYVGCS